MTGCAAMSCDARPASRQPHPPPTQLSPSPDAVMLRITSSGLRGPLPSAPRGSLLFHCAPEPSQPLASRRDCHSSGIPVSFFVRSGYRGRPCFARMPRSRAHFSSPPGPCRRPLRGDCFTPAARRIFSLSRPGRLRFAQTALAGVIAAIAVSRTALRLERDTSPRCFF